MSLTQYLTLEEVVSGFANWRRIKKPGDHRTSKIFISSRNSSDKKPSKITKLALLRRSFFSAQSKLTNCLFILFSFAWMLYVIANQGSVYFNLYVVYNTVVLNFKESLKNRPIGASFCLRV